MLRRIDSRADINTLYYGLKLNSIIIIIIDKISTIYKASNLDLSNHWGWRIFDKFGWVMAG